MRLLGRIILAIGVASLATAFGCKTDSVYKEKEAPISSTIQTAEESGANASTSAAFYLRLAKEEFNRAKELASHSGKRDEAASLLQRADADAELAAALAKEESEKKGAADAISSVRQLRRDNGMPVDDKDGSTP